MRLRFAQRIVGFIAPLTKKNGQKINKSTILTPTNSKNAVKLLIEVFGFGGIADT
jgi:hypothetical protein